MARKALDIHYKIILVLVAVIVPTHFIASLVLNKLTEPILENEMLSIGLASAESMSSKSLSSDWLGTSRPDAVRQMTGEIFEILYRQPNILRMDVYRNEPDGQTMKLLATNIDEDLGKIIPVQLGMDRPQSHYESDEEELPYWEIWVPIQKRATRLRGKPGAVLGQVHLLISTRTVSRLVEAFWRINVIAASVSVVVLIGFLSFFLRKTFLNERKLRDAEDQNLSLSRELHDTQRQLMNVEKLAVMGQLTANLAHEIGTPLNAIGGHLQLLQEEMSPNPKAPRSSERLGIVLGEVERIERIVKDFLQTTAKPPSLTQLVDLNQLVDRALYLVRPRADELGVVCVTDLDRALGPVRAVPLDIEQLLLNLLSNSLDSLETKRQHKSGGRLELRVQSLLVRRGGKEFVELRVFDTGVGISKDNLAKVFKPFFTTKAPGKGTGLGLNICQQLAEKHGGKLGIDSKEGVWTEVSLQLPFRGEA